MADNEKSVHEKHSHDSERTATNVEDVRPRKKSFVDVDMDKLSAAFENPLSGVPKAQLLEDVETFCQEHNLMDHIDVFRRGALVAQRPNETDSIEELTAEDRDVLNREKTHRWSQPFTLYWLVIMCSLAAAVQGMDETVNNGAQALYLKELNVTTDRFSPDMVDNLTGLIVGAPYCKLPSPSRNICIQHERPSQLSHKLHVPGKSLMKFSSMLCHPRLLVDRAV